MESDENGSASSSIGLGRRRRLRHHAAVVATTRTTTATASAAASLSNSATMTNADADNLSCHRHHGGQQEEEKAAAGGGLQKSSIMGGGHNANAKQEHDGDGVGVRDGINTNGDLNYDDYDDDTNDAGHCFLALPMTTTTTSTRGGAASNSNNSQRASPQPPIPIHDNDAASATTTTSTIEVNNVHVTNNKGSNNSSNNNNLQRYSPRKARRPPERFVARASKQGWGVADGDRAFLENDARYYTNTTSNNGSASSVSATTSITTAAGTLSASAVATARTSNNGTPAIRGEKKSRPTTKTESTTTTSQIQPSSASKMPPTMKSSSSSLSSTTATVPVPWTCHKCTTINNPSRMRCSACQGWKRSGTTTTSPSSSSSAPSRSKSASTTTTAKTTTDVKARRNERSGVGGGGGPSGGRARGARSSAAKGTTTTASSSGRKIHTHPTTSTTTTAATAIISNIATTTTTTSKRKSAISRRPRQLRPTEKMIAYKNDLEEEKLWKTSLSSLQQQQQHQHRRHQEQQQQSRKRKAEVALAGEEDRGVAQQPSQRVRKKNRTIVSSASTAMATIATTTAAAAAAVNDIDSCAPLADRYGGGSIEHFDNDEKGNDEGKENASAYESYEDVVCCLCKCAVDFSDMAYFLPPTTSSPPPPMTEADGMMDSIVNDNGVTNSGRKEKCVREMAKTEDDSKQDDAKYNGNISEESEAVCTIGAGAATDLSEQSCDQMMMNAEGTTDDGTPVKTNDTKLEHDLDIDDDDDSMPAFQLPHRFYDPTNALILCDGPAYAKKNKRHEEDYKCERAFHQRCHFVPVLSIPRGPWRCLVCKYHDEMYLKEKSSNKKNGSSVDRDGGAKLSNVELNVIFRCHPVPSTSCAPSLLKEEVGADATTSIESVNVDQAMLLPQQQFTQCHSAPDNVINLSHLEQRFEVLSAPLKSHLLHNELTTRSRNVIKSSLATIRTAEHSLRSITETSKVRKALAERVECEELGLPQELCQTVMRIALCKTRIRDMIFSLENVIRSRPPHHDVADVPLLVGLKSSSEKDDEEDGDKLRAVNDDDDDRIDPISELMTWYLLQQGCSTITADAQANETAPKIIDTTTITSEMAKGHGKSLLHQLFPQGNLSQRRSEPRTGEAHVHNSKDNSGDGDSVTSISLDDLVCWTCHGTDASDENDMLLCDGVGCCRAFHMKCLEPKLTLDDVHMSDDDNWFCPLCTAHATLIHYAQCEYFGDDLEASTMSPSKKGRTSGHISFNNRCISEWETAKDVFAEAPFELRVAQKFKENIRDEETAKFLAEELGTVTRLYTSAVEPGKRSEVDLSFDLEDDGTDDDFDNEEDELDDESLAEEVDLERQFAKETIDRDELDALSFTSDDDDDNSHASSTNLDDASNFNSATHRPRRSKRKRFTLPEEGGDINEDGNINGMRSSDIGTLDVANIVRGKRSRTKVDYRKLADVMFGDEPDDDAMGSKKEYAYKPTKKKARKNEGDSDDDDDDDDGSDDVSGEYRDHIPETKKSNNKMSGKLEARETRRVRVMNGKGAQPRTRRQGTRGRTSQPK